MVPMAKITFKALLDWFMEQNAKQWHIHVQASQFDAQDYVTAMNPTSGLICLNISANATRKFDITDESFSFWSKFQGKEIFLDIPFSAVYCAIDPVTGIPNVFPYFEDYGDIEPEFQESFASPGELVKVLDDDGNTTEITIPTREEIDELNRIWAERGSGIECQGFKVGENGKLALVATRTTDAPNTAKIIDFPQRAIESDNRKQLSHDTVETKVRDRRWTVIEGGKTKVEASMPWIDVVYREKLARREAQRLNNDRLVLGNEMKSTNPNDPEGLTFGQLFYYPCDKDGTLYDPTAPIKLDVTKCVWASKPIKRPSWMKVIEGGKDDA